MPTPKVTLVYLDPNWELEVRKPCAANGHQYIIHLDGVEVLIGEELFPRFLHDLRGHLGSALSDSERAERERLTHVGEAGL